VARLSDRVSITLQFPGHLQATLSNLVSYCVQVSSASGIINDDWLTDYRVKARPVWLVGAVVCLHAVRWVRLFASAGNG